MDFFIELFLISLTIVIVFLLFRLKCHKINASSLSKSNLELREQLKENKLSQEFTESNLHQTISKLQNSLLEEQESIKSYKSELDLNYSELQKQFKTLQDELLEEQSNRKKVASQKKSSEVRLGNVAETLAPFLDQFEFDPENCVFLGKPIDYISFDEEEITFIEVKMGKSQLSAKQRHIRDLIKDKQIAWKEIRIK